MRCSRGLRSTDPGAQQCTREARYLSAGSLECALCSMDTPGSRRLTGFDTSETLSGLLRPDELDRLIVEEQVRALIEEHHL